MNTLPRISADFQKVDDKKRVVLTTIGTREDLARAGIELKEGLRLLLYDEDQDDRGKRDDLVAEATVQFDKSRSRWVAVIDWEALRHESEIAKEE